MVEAAVSGGHGGRSVPYRNRPAGQDEGVHAGMSKLKLLAALVMKGQRNPRETLIYKFTRKVLCN